MKMAIEKGILGTSKTREIGENIKIIIRTNTRINGEITMKEIGPTPEIDTTMEIDPMIEINLII